MTILRKIRFRLSGRLGSQLGKFGSCGVVLGMLAGFLAGCASDAPVGEGAPGGPPGSYGPGYPAGSAQWSRSWQVAYRDGFLAGQRDGKDGFRFNSDRGEKELEEKVRPYFSQGYRRGYYHDGARKAGSAATATPTFAPSPMEPPAAATGLGDVPDRELLVPDFSMQDPEIH